MDINRNYGYKFGFDEEGSVSDPCDEIYRGKGPFSEYETQAVKYLVEKSGKISSAMNFHAFGNLWITPYCYYTGNDNFGLMKPEIANFYKNFEEEIKTMGFYKTGDAKETIKYPANGEASDWMLASHDIISLSPELGSNLETSNSFYPDKETIIDVINEDYRVVELFIRRSLPTFNDSEFGYASESNFIKDKSDLAFNSKTNKHFGFKMQVKNSGITPAKDMIATIKYFDKNINKVVKNVYAYKEENLVPLSFTIDKKNKMIKINESLDIDKLSSSFIYIEMSEKFNFDFKLVLKRYDMEIYSFKNYSDHAAWDLYNSIKKAQLEGYILFFWVFCILILMYFVIYYWNKMRKEADNLHIIEFVNEVKKNKNRGKTYIDDDEDA